MKLSTRQQRMVYSFLQESDATVAALSPGARTQTIAQVRKRLWQELGSMGKDVLEDDEVTCALGRIRVTATGWMPPPELKQAPSVPELRLKISKRDPVFEALSPERVPSEPVETPPSAHAFASADRVWLGVCLDLAGRHDWDAHAVRYAFFATGLVTGPLALVVYLGLYFMRYVEAVGEEVPRINARGVAGPSLALVVTCVGLYLGTRLGVAGVVAVAGQAAFAESALVDLGWRVLESPAILAGALLVALPVAMLGALPVPEQWSVRATRFVRAVLGVYAIVLALCAASVFVDVLVAAVKDLLI